MTDNNNHLRMFILNLFWLPIIIYFLIGITGLAYAPFHDLSLELLNSGQKRSPSESAFIEHLEAFYWLLGFGFYLIALLKRRFLNRDWPWCLLFTSLCFVALGEETSWGQHLLNYTPPKAVVQINTQSELNIHNLHLAKTLGIREDNPLYPYMGNLTVYLNPLFYFVCCCLWLIFPLMIQYWKLGNRWGFLSHYPQQPPTFNLSFTAAIVIYLLIDKTVLDVGELFELTLATVACLTGGLRLVSGQGNAAHS